MGEIKEFHETKGMPPLEEPIVGSAIEKLLAEEDALRSAEHAANRSANPARLIASDAFKCARQIAFGRLGVPKDITYTPEQLMTFRAGDFYHDVVQRSLIRDFNARTEVEFDWRPEFDLYGKVDGVSDDSVFEIKSQAGYGFDLSTGARRSAEGPGPKKDHLMQAGFGALCPTLNRQFVHVIYVNKDRGVVAEWKIDVDQPLLHLPAYADNTIPTIRTLIEFEKERMSAILGIIDGGEIPKPNIPDYGLVVEPPEPGSRGAQPWNCAYCSWQPTCKRIGCTRVPITEVLPE